MGLPVCEIHDAYSMKSHAVPEIVNRKTSIIENEESFRALVSCRPKLGNLYNRYSVQDLDQNSTALKENIKYGDQQTSAMNVELRKCERNDIGLVKTQKKDELSEDPSIKLACYLLIGALSIQAIFMGLAFGAFTYKGNLIYIAISLAMILHKWIEGLTIGLSLTHGKVRIRDCLKIL